MDMKKRHFWGLCLPLGLLFLMLAGLPAQAESSRFLVKNTQPFFIEGYHGLERWQRSWQTLFQNVVSPRTAKQWTKATWRPVRHFFQNPFNMINPRPERRTAALNFLDLRNFTNRDVAEARYKRLSFLSVSNDLYGGSVDFALRPLGYSKASSGVFDPYVFVGMGSFYQDPKVGVDRAQSPVLGANMGWGSSVFLTRNLSVNMEQSMRPVILEEENRGFDASNSNSTNFLPFFYTVIGSLRFRF